MKKNIWNIIGTLVSAAIVIGFFLYLWKEQDTLLSLLDISGHHVFALGLLVLITRVLDSMQGYYLTRAQGCDIGILEAFWIYTAAGLANYLPFRAGTIIRFHYLKKVHGLRYARSVSLMTARTVSFLFITGAIGLSGTLVLAHRGGMISYEMLSCFLLMMALSVALYFLPTPDHESAQASKSLAARVLRDFGSGLGDIRKMNRLVVILTLLIFLQSVCMILRLYVCFDALQFNVDKSIFLVLAPISVLTLYLSITPGGLGLREGIMGYVTLITGHDFNMGMFAGVLDRAMLMVLYIVLGAPALVYCQMRMNKKQAIDSGHTSS